MTDKQADRANLNAQLLALDDLEDTITEEMTITDIKEMIKAKKREIRHKLEKL